MGNSRKWLLDERLVEIRLIKEKAPKLALNAPRSEEDKLWVQKRDNLLHGWDENELLDLTAPWSMAATGENKITMVPPHSPSLHRVCAIYANV